MTTKSVTGIGIVQWERMKSAAVLSIYINFLKKNVLYIKRYSKGL